VPATVGETFYDLAIRSLEEQEREVSSLRSRTGTLVAAAAVAATLLGREVFIGTHPDGLVEWVACGTGLVALGVVLGASVHLLRSHNLTFSLDAAATFEEAEADGALEHDAEALQIGLTYSLAAIQAGNSATVLGLKVAFAWALGGLVVEILGLGLSAALV
jgi:hypothetical protein